MRFAIINGLPYYITSGKAVPCKINGPEVILSNADAFDYEGSGYLSLYEVRAKFGDCTSIPKKKPARKAKEIVEE